MSANVSREDHRKAAVSLIAWTLVLTLAWAGLHIRFGDDDAIDALSALPFLFALLYSMRYTYLKERSGSVQAVFIGGFTLVFALILLGAEWIAGQI